MHGWRVQEDFPLVPLVHCLGISLHLGLQIWNQDIVLSLVCGARSRTTRTCCGVRGLQLRLSVVLRFSGFRCDCES